MRIDESEDQRLILDRKIQACEQKMDKTAQEKRQNLDQLNHCQLELDRENAQITELYQVLALAGDEEAGRNLEEDQELSSFLDKKLSEQGEELEQVYRQRERKLENKREKLYNERGTLLW